MSEVLILSLNIFSAIGSFGLSLYSFLTKDKAIRKFAVFSLAVGIWILANFLGIYLKSPFLVKTTYLLGTILAILGFEFVMTFLNFKVSPFWKILYWGVGNIFIFASLFSNLLVKEIKEISAFKVEIELGYLFLPWALFILALVLISFFSLLRFYLTTLNQRTKLKVFYLLLGMGISGIWSAIVSAFLPLLGIESLNNLDAPSMFLMVSIVSYALLAHNIFDLQQALVKALTFGFWIGVLSFLAFLLILAGALFFGILGLKGIVLVSIFTGSLAFYIGFSFYKQHQNLVKAKEEAEEAKQVLEIKVKARTRELQELNQQLEAKVEEKTKELKEHIEELEKFHQLVVGRELKMIELKKKLAETQKELQRLKAKIKTLK